jgi:hypothetical protein
MTDDIDQIKNLLKAPPGPSPAAVAAAERRLTAEFHAPLVHSSTTERRRRRRRIVILPVVATAVAGAAALAAIAVGGTPFSPSAPSSASSASSPATVPLNDTSIYLAAASEAEKQPAGAFWHSDVVSGIARVLPKGYAVIVAANEFFHWTAVKPGGGDLLYGRNLPARPATGKDAAAWRAAGSPSSFHVVSGNGSKTYTTKAGPWQADAPGKGGRFYLPGSSEGLTNEQVQALPTDPAALTKLLFQPLGLPTAKAKAAAAKSKKMGGVKGIIRKPIPPNEVLSAGTVLTAPVPPKVRAGVMRALAQRPGIRQLGAVTDVLGRRGIAIGTNGPVYREELIFNEKTGAYLGEEEVLLTPNAVYPGQKPGFVIGYDLMRSSGWTNTKPVPPLTLPFQ